MIRNISFNNLYLFTPQKPRSYYLKPINLNRLHKDTISFSGKNNVIQDLFGKSESIPKIVEYAKQCQKNLFMFNDQGRVIGLGNCVYLGNNYFLTAGHCCPEDVKSFGIGKLIKGSSISPVDSVVLRSNIDLAVVHCKSRLHPETVPIKIAKSMPAKPETVYITGQNLELTSTKAIPSIYIGKKSWFNRLLPAKNIPNETFDAYYSKIGSSILVDHNKDSAGLSGSPILNKDGELIGILSSSNRGHIEMENFLVPDLEAIKSFLAQQKTSLSV